MQEHTKPYVPLPLLEVEVAVASEDVPREGVNLYKERSVSGP